MEFKGTKGEWGYGMCGHIIEVWKIGGGLPVERLAELPRMKSDDTKNTKRLANAKIIAAAPEMLEMLKRIDGEILRSDGCLDVNKWCDQIELLIKKATEL